MNLLYTFGASVQLMLFAKQQLESMHQFIDRKNVPAVKDDDFYQQAINLEQAAGYGEFARCHRRFSVAQTSLKWIAYIVTTIALAIFLLSKFGPTSEPIRAWFDWLMSDFMLFVISASVAAGAIFLILIALHFYARAVLSRLLGKELVTLWDRVIHRWAPDFSPELGELERDPQAIAAQVTQYASSVRAIH
jgi:hypothetical protein